MKTVVFIVYCECQKDLAPATEGRTWRQLCRDHQLQPARGHQRCLSSLPYWTGESFLFLLHCYKALPLKTMILWMPQMPSAKQAALGWVGTGPAQTAILPQGRFEPYPQSSQRLPLTWLKRWRDRENLTLYDLKLCCSENTNKQTHKFSFLTFICERLDLIVLTQQFLLPNSLKYKV